MLMGVASAAADPLQMQNQRIDCCQLTR